MNYYGKRTVKKHEPVNTVNGIGSSKRRFQPRSATGAPIWRHQLTPIKAPILFVAAAVCREAGFFPENLFMSDSALPPGCACGVARAPRLVLLGTHPPSRPLL